MRYREGLSYRSRCDWLSGALRWHSCLIRRHATESILLRMHRRGRYTVSHAVKPLLVQRTLQPLTPGSERLLLGLQMPYPLLQLLFPLLVFVFQLRELFLQFANPGRPPLAERSLCRAVLSLALRRRRICRRLTARLRPRRNNPFFARHTELCSRSGGEHRRHGHIPGPCHGGVDWCWPRGRARSDSDDRYRAGWAGSRS